MNEVEARKPYKTKMLVEAGLAIAMTQILGMIIVYQMPQGGAVKAANLVPLLIYSYRWGARAGILAGMAYGLFHFFVGFKFTVHYLSIILDYILAYGAVGLAGLVKGNTRISALWGGLIGGIVKIGCSIVSGAVVFGEYAPAGQNAWVYSTVYNMTYALPDLVINLVVIALIGGSLMKRLQGISASQRM